MKTIVPQAAYWWLNIQEPAVIVPCMDLLQQSIYLICVINKLNSFSVLSQNSEHYKTIALTSLHFWIVQLFDLETFNNNQYFQDILDKYKYTETNPKKN